MTSGQPALLLRRDSVLGLFAKGDTFIRIDYVLDVLGIQIWT